MSGFDMGGLGAMLGGFQKRLEDMKETIARTEVEGTAGGGLVRITCTCDHNVTAVKIAPEAAEDVEMLEDLVRAALNEANRKAQDESTRLMATVTAGLPIPPGLIPGL